MRIILLFLLGIWISGHGFSQQRYDPVWESLDKRPVPRWFSDAKFGIFVHWGIYSVPAWAPSKLRNVEPYNRYAEHYWYQLSKNNPYFRAYHDSVYGKSFKYQDFAPLFKAQNFNPDQWADLFYSSGARYVILTSKHHDGFALWPSSQSWNWNSLDIGPHRDLCGELSKAVKARGLHMGFYYSLLEWFNPLYQVQTGEYVNNHMIPQMKDLVTRYDPDVLWTDGEWDYPSAKFRSEEFLAWLYNESPVKEQVVVNDRWGKETRSKHGGFYTTEYGETGGGSGPDESKHRKWEECRGIGFSFGYNKTEDLEDYNSSEELIHLLIKKIASGGNLLLNVGPTADGLIPVIMQERLKDIGNWLRVNGEAVYETEPASLVDEMKTGNIYFTRKGDNIYVIITQWPGKPIKIKGVPGAKSLEMAGLTEKVKFRFSGNSLTIFPPQVTPATIPCSYAWTFKIVTK